MTITAKVVADSIYDEGPRLTTLQMRYPRMIHAECKTHRLLRVGDAEYEFLQEISFMHDPNLSRNASSSRAIPIERMIQDVIDDPAMPVAWGSNKPGMQAGAEIDTPVRIYEFIVNSEWVGYNASPKEVWLEARDLAVEFARGFADAGYHKQIVNRLLEPFGHISVVCTATEWDNFFELRCHPDADPTMRALAEAMRAAMDASKPKKLTNGEWHLPYVEETDLPYLTRAKISAARCARVSYLTHDGQKPSVEQDLALYERLAGSRPLHASPLEHQASPDLWDQPELHGNLRGWKQFRKLVEMGRVS